jgi:hypothetical protein
MSNKENKMDVDDGNEQEEKDENMQEDEVRYR